MRRLSSVSLPTRQRGLAVLVLLALFATAAAFMLVSALNKGSVAMSTAKSEKNRAVMQEAKAALIAYAASETLQGGNFQPGRLPCPDRDNNGNADSSCTTAVSRLGRLPYKTLGIAELRDASGELLWYAVSNNFRTGASVINSDTLGTLTVSGLAPATNAVAVVLAPGARLGTQDRSPAEASCNSSAQACNTASNYLEGINGDANYSDYIGATENVTDPVVANLFNDQLLAITQQDLMSIVEPVVAARIQRDIVAQYIYDSDPALTDSGFQWSDDNTKRNKSRYFDAWGGFPFAAPFADPSTSNWTGQATPTPKYEGLLPIVDSLTLVGSANYPWTLGSGTVVQTGGTGSISSFNCGATTASILTCSITSSGFFNSQPSFRMSGTVAGVGRAFVQLPRLADLRGNTVFTRSLSGTLTSAGAGIVMLDATMPWSLFGTTVTVQIRNDNLLDSPLISPTDGTAGWFTTNNWHRLTYYAVSPGYAPGGSGSCNATSPQCLTVDALNPPNTNPTTNSRAVLILAGRSLSGTARPNGTLSDYLEGKNASTGDYSFEHGAGKTTTVAGAPAAINDRVILIAP